MRRNGGKDPLDHQSIFGHTSEAAVEHSRSKVVEIAKKFAGTLRPFHKLSQNAHRPLAAKQLDDALECDFLLHFEYLIPFSTTQCPKRPYRTLLTQLAMSQILYP